MTRLLLTLSLLSGAAGAHAQGLPPALDDPALEEPDGFESQAAEVPHVEAARPSPAPERAGLVSLGATLGLTASLAGAALVAAIAFPLDDGCCGYASIYATLAALPITALLTIPAGVFLFGNLSGRGADFGWTLLGSVIGALPGAAMIAIGYPIDEGDRVDPGLFYAGGGVLAGVGAITGAILAFELSSRPSAAAPRASVGIDPRGGATLAVSGTF
jgi:hypothetical protein